MGDGSRVEVSVLLQLWPSRVINGIRTPATKVICVYIYTLRLFNIAMGNDPFIDGLPFLKMGGSFHGYVK